MSEYNDLTPRQLHLIAENFNDTAHQKQELMMVTAYLTASWQRAKRLPSLKKVLEDARPKKQEPQQTAEQMLAVVKRLHAQLSGEEG